jgi:hypothetical protein
MTDKNLEQKLNPAEQPGFLPASEIAPTPEQQPVTEAGAELPSTPESAPVTKENTATTRRRRPIQSTGPITSGVRDEVVLRIEKIMEDGVGDAFQRLSPTARQEFKIKGEQTALKIREILQSSHIKVKKIFQLILEWLKMLPGVNRFFLEQEAKIKTDHIITLHKKHHGQT